MKTAGLQFPGIRQNVTFYFTEPIVKRLSNFTENLDILEKIEL